MKVKFTQGAPKEPGQYLRRGLIGIELVTIYLKTSSFPRHWASNEFDTYLAISEYGGKSLDRFEDGWFSEKIEEDI
jgi:hypothetical protein